MCVWLHMYNYHRAHTALGASHPQAASPTCEGSTTSARRLLNVETPRRATSHSAARPGSRPATLGGLSGFGHPSRLRAGVAHGVAVPAQQPGVPDRRYGAARVSDRYLDPSAGAPRRAPSAVAVQSQPPTSALGWPTEPLTAGHGAA
jgi:hypothetical protein